MVLMMDMLETINSIETMVQDEYNQMKDMAEDVDAELDAIMEGIEGLYAEVDDYQAEYQEY